MNELFDVKKPMHNNYMNAKQILLYVNKLLKPYEICIRSYRGEAYNIIQLYEFDAWIETKTKNILQAQYEHSDVQDEGKASS